MTEPQIQRHNYTPAPIRRGVRSYFIGIIYKILQSGLFSECIYWNEDGSRFIITIGPRFDDLIVSKLLNYNSFNSFRTQLSRNFNIEKREAIWICHNPHFRRGNISDSLSHRIIPMTKTREIIFDQRLELVYLRENAIAMNKKMADLEAEKKHLTARYCELFHKRNTVTAANVKRG